LGGELVECSREELVVQKDGEIGLAQLLHIKVGGEDSGVDVKKNEGREKEGEEKEDEEDSKEPPNPDHPFSSLARRHQPRAAALRGS
jgi:hypothetical protein